MSSYKGKNDNPFLWITLIVVLILLGAVAMISLFDGVPQKEKQTVKISQKSDINTVEAIVRTHIKGVKGPQPDIVWLNEKTGAEVSEAFIFDNPTPFTNKQKTFLRNEMVKMGYKRVLESCQGLTDEKFRWTVGYCTYRDAPIGLEG